MSTQDAIRRARAWLATLERGQAAGYAEWHEAADDLAALGPASVALAVALSRKHKYGKGHDPAQCDPCKALAAWTEAAGEPRESHG